MANLPLRLGEEVIRKEGGRLYGPNDRISAWLTLTSQRLFVETVLHGTSTYPLSRVTRVSEVSAPAMLMTFKLLEVAFDNGATIRFGLSSRVDYWINLIEEARKNAPDLPDEPMPAPRLDDSPSPMPRIILVGIISAAILCLCVTMVVMSAVLLLLGTPQ